MSSIETDNEYVSLVDVHSVKKRVKKSYCHAGVLLGTYFYIDIQTTYGVSTTLECSSLEDQFSKYTEIVSRMEKPHE